MKKPHHRRGNPKQKSVGPAPADANVGQIAAAAQYVGSVIHKDTPSFAGPVPRPQPDRSVCPRALNQDRATVQMWLRQAILAGHYSALWMSGFPKYVWHREDDTIFEGQLMSPYGEGRYKGYPLESDQQVRGLP